MMIMFHNIKHNINQTHVLACGKVCERMEESTVYVR